MNVMIIGNGGRESAIKWKISKNKKVKNIISHEQLGEIKSVEEYLKFAMDNKVDLTIVGSEEMLVKGIVDEFKSKGLAIFGADQKSAMLEGSKSLAKSFMERNGVKTARYGVFEQYDRAFLFLEEAKYPIVIKADGLAAGKGVFIVNNILEAQRIIQDLLCYKSLGESGTRVVIEEYLDGVEASILSIYDGQKITPFISAKDHKKIGEGETGPNTGGIGVIAPNPFLTKEVWQQFQNDILLPTQEGLKKEDMDFAGVIFFGLMITKDGVFLLEYNMRLGDPETQAVLPLMESDLLDVIESAMRGNLNEIKWRDKHSCCVVVSSGGYPLAYKTGFEIKGLDKVKGNLFEAGVKYEDGIPITDGGRVVGVVGVGNTPDEARKKAYKDVEKIEFENMYYRKDIGLV